jgi:hypothetical protein
MTPTPATPADTEASTPAALHSLSSEDHGRLRSLARRYRIRADTTLRPVADVVYDLRSRHGIQLSMGQVFELLAERRSR